MAATHDRTTSWNLTDDATFRTWASAIHDAIVDAGLVQTADTGQINLATVTRPAGADTLAGYAVYRFNDAEQAGNPIFLKVYFYSGDANTQGRLWFEVGKGTNGAGTLTTAATLASTTSADATDAADRIIHCSFAEGAFVLLAGASVAASGQNFLCIIEREMDEDGAYTGRIIFMCVVGSAACMIFDGGAWTNYGSNGTHAATIAMPGFQPDPDGRVPVGLVYPGGWRAPLRSHIIMRETSVAEDESGDVSIDGVTRTYIATGTHVNITGNSGPCFWGTSTQIQPRSLWLNE